MDEETGLYYYGARYYEPQISIWLSVDPLAEKYPMMSSYAYAFNNPSRYTDPTSMSGEDQLSVKSETNRDIITHTNTVTRSSTRIVKKGSDEYIKLLGKSTIYGQNSIGDKIKVSQTEVVKTITSIMINYDEDGNEQSRSSSQKVMKDSKVDVTVFGQYGGTSGGYSNSTKESIINENAKASTPLLNLSNVASSYRSEYGVSITNRNEFAGALARQQNAVNIYDQWSSGAAVGLGWIGKIKYGSGPGLALSLFTTGVGISLERGLEGIKARSKSNPCNSCTKIYPYK